MSGTRATISSVASMPSICGIRRSMITTSGRRRSASATAVSPSGASPTTRMCDERRSASRSPSRTTSWSSAIRTVISPFSATRRGFYDRGWTPSRGLHTERELLGLRGGPDRRSPGPPRAPRELADGRPHRLDLARRKIGASGVEPLVVGQRAPASHARAPPGNAPAFPGEGRARSPRSRSPRRHAPRERHPREAPGRPRARGGSGRARPPCRSPPRRGSGPSRDGGAEVRCPAPSPARCARRASGRRS